MNCTLDDNAGAASDEESVHSAVSYESGADEEEDAEYLALELLHHLPAEKANRLIRSLRSKEKSMQELQRRHQQLLDSYTRLNEAMSKPPTAPPAPAPAPAQPSDSSGAAPAAKAGAPVVDKSIWLKMQGNKDETIRKLKEENHYLHVQVARLDDYSRQLGQSLRDTQTDLKRVMRRMDPKGAATRLPPEEAPSADISALDEWERQQAAEAASKQGQQPQADSTAEAAKSKNKRKKKRSERNGAVAKDSQQASDSMQQGATDDPNDQSSPRKEESLEVSPSPKVSAADNPPPGQP
mmetsp:Transcript_11249/g.20560  ORF Transcript_11249/g.20560 Transcript_11249/m.20560 type:complete len:295 (-) Transcript_11249:240-1124(-)